MYRIRNWLVATLLLLCAPVGAATLSDIQVSNGNQQARITLSFIGDPDYAFSHQSKRTVALDIKQTGVIQGLPLLFSGNNLVKAIRSGTPKDAQTLRLVVDLTENGKTEAKTTKDNKRVIDPNKPMIALTFDDGPGERTLELLETLEKYKVRASFFMCGTSLSRNDIKVEEILKKMDELGCDMGNHTMDHQSLLTLSSKKIKWEVEGVNDLIKKHVGHGTKFVRPPYGAGIRDKKVSKYVNAPMVCWSVDTLDWKTKSKKETIRSVMNDAHDGDIVLMHDIHGWTVDAVKKIVPKLLKKGYQLVTVSEMAEAKGYKLENRKPYFEFF